MIIGIITHFALQGNLEGDEKGRKTSIVRVEKIALLQRQKKLVNLDLDKVKAHNSMEYRFMGSFKCSSTWYIVL